MERILNPFHKSLIRYHKRNWEKLPGQLQGHQDTLIQTLTAELPMLLGPKLRTVASEHLKKTPNVEAYWWVDDEGNEL
ncbi:MAG: hypothetical protein KDD25_07715, partial [Bdellovibrionales bacterium]|nr:hypothetical protein [Bdellovibrionales bacterium]